MSIHSSVHVRVLRAKLHHVMSIRAARPEGSQHKQLLPVSPMITPRAESFLRLKWEEQELSQTMHKREAGTIMTSTRPQKSNLCVVHIMYPGLLHWAHACPCLRQAYAKSKACTLTPCLSSPARLDLHFSISLLPLLITVMRHDAHPSTPSSLSLSLLFLFSFS